MLELSTTLRNLASFPYSNSWVPSWTGVVMASAGRVCFLQGCGSQEASQAPGSGPTYYTQAALSGLNVYLNNLKRRCKNLVGKLVVEGKN